MTDAGALNHVLHEAIERARSVSILDVLERRGIKLRKQSKWMVGPCPCCGHGTDRFSVKPADNVWYCRHCNPRGGQATVIGLVQSLDRVPFRVAVERLADFVASSSARSGSRPKPQAFNRADEEKSRQHQKAAWLWRHRKPIFDSVAERYLRDVRCYGGPLPPTLGFLPPSKPEHHPAMIAAFGMPNEPEPGLLGQPRNVDAVHLTFLKPDGSGKAEVKPNKIVVGSPNGRPIALAPVNDLLGLAFTEGIEDALALHQATGLGAWAAGSASYITRALADSVPDYVECITISVDDNPAGRKGSDTIAPRLRGRGKEVRLLEGRA